MKPTKPCNKNEPCPAEQTLRVVGGKWKIPILFFLWTGTHRFSELRSALGHVAPKVMTQQLREMEADGLLTRKVFAEVPPRVEYALTAKGKSLRPVVDAMVRWGKTHMQPRGSKS